MNRREADVITTLYDVLDALNRRGGLGIHEHRRIIQVLGVAKPLYDQANAVIRGTEASNHDNGRTTDRDAVTR